MPLRHKITLRQPITPEITIEDGAIYVRLPAAIEPGLAGKVLKEMPKIPEKRLKELETSLKSLYPKEAGLLEGILNQIREAKTEEDRAARRKDVQVYRINLIFSNVEADIVKKVLGKRPAQKILSFCQKELQKSHN